MPGFANWKCVWGTTDEDSTRVTLEFRLDDVEVLNFFDENYTRTKIGGNDAFIDSAGQRICNVKVMHRTVGAVLEIFEVHLRSPLSVEERCDQATKLAEAAEEQLPDI